VQMALIEHLSRVWQEPDQGIWEVRTEPQHFTYSKVMAWVAVDRVIKSAETFGLEGPLDHWRNMREEIFKDVCARGFDAQMGSFVQSYGSKHLDASLLLLPSMRFLPIADPRIEGTVKAIERNLMVDGLLMRYYDSEKTVDGLPPGEGVFLACSFWLVDVYLLQGRRREAERLFRRLVGLCNDVGLISEEYDPRAKRLVGNFPQAFTHVSLVNSAYNLTDSKKPVHQRAQQTDAAVAVA
jgi:GH15 family glucan-1,4-alpha-glucosidase